MSADPCQEEMKRLTEHPSQNDSLNPQPTAARAPVASLRGARVWETLLARLFPNRRLPSTTPFSDEHLKALRLSTESRLLLGHDEHNEPLFLPPRSAAPTVIVSDSWREMENLSTSLAMQRIALGGGLVFVDFEGSAYIRDRLAETARLCERESDFYVLTPGEPEKSHTYSPWANGDSDELAAKGLLALPPNEENTLGGLYEYQTANHLLCVLTGSLLDANRAFTTADLLTLIQSPSALEALLEMLPDPEHQLPLQLMLNEFRGPDGKIGMQKLEDVTAWFSARLSALSQKGPRRMDTLNPEVDIAEIVRQGKCLYVSQPDFSESEFNNFMARAILEDVDDAFCSLNRQKRDKRPRTTLILAGMHPVIGTRYLQKLAERTRISGTEMFVSANSLSALSGLFGVARAEQVPDYFPLIGLSLSSADRDIFTRRLSASGRRKPVEANHQPFLTSAAAGASGERLTGFVPKLAGAALEAPDIGNRPFLRTYPTPLDFATRFEDSRAREVTDAFLQKINAPRVARRSG